MSGSSTVALQLMSDLHLESGSGYDTFEITPRAPFLGLLGDIGRTIDDKLFTFLERQLRRFRVIFFILGNHEAYESSISESKERLAAFSSSCNLKRQTEPSLGEFVFLDQTRYDIDDKVTVLGCTLFSNVLPDQREAVTDCLLDFYDIADWTVDKHIEAHKSDISWLTDQLTQIRQKNPERRIIVVTHHSPTIIAEANDPLHAGSKISSAFVTDLVPDHLCMNQIKVWAFGHTHYNCDIQLDEMRLYTNQMGYAFDLSEGFNKDRVICV